MEIAKKIVLSAIAIAPSVDIDRHFCVVAIAGKVDRDRSFLAQFITEIFLKKRIIEVKLRVFKKMTYPVTLIPGAISEILVSARNTGAITLADRYGLMAAILDESLPEDDARSINRLLRAIMRGKIKVADDLSAMV